MTQHHDSQLPHLIDGVIARFDGVVDDRDRIRRERDAARRERDAARARADRLWLAWRSAVQRACRWRNRAELRLSVRDRMRRQLEHAIEERDVALTDASTIRQTMYEALGLTSSDLRSEDLVEPGDEVPALAELADRVAALEAAVDAHLGTTEEAAGGAG